MGPMEKGNETHSFTRAGIDQNKKMHLDVGSEPTLSFAYVTYGSEEPVVNLFYKVMHKSLCARCTGGLKWKEYRILPIKGILPNKGTP